MSKGLKKIIGVAVLAIVLSLGFAWWTTSANTELKEQCAFCNELVIQTHTFYEDDLVRGMCTHKPVTQGHCMVVLKRHTENLEDLTDEEFSAAGKLLRKINTATQVVRGPSSYLVLEKNGPEVGQTVPHVHIHYIPKEKSKNKTAAMFGLLWKFVANIFHRPLQPQALSKEVDTMKQAFADL